MSRRWFITGASRGLGRAFAEAALAAGDRVVGVARDVEPLADLVARSGGALSVFPLDVSDRSAVMTGAGKAFDEFDGIDVVVNNAGGSLLGMVEEVTEEQVRAHLDTNLFGALWVCQAVVPLLREQGSGHILQIATVPGAGGGFATTGLYGAGKAALEVIGGSLAMEVEPFGIAVTTVHPGGYETGLFTQGLVSTEPCPAYAPLRGRIEAMFGEAEDFAPAKAAEVVMTIVGLDAPPKRVILGGAAYDMSMEMFRETAAEFGRWEALSRQGD